MKCIYCLQDKPLSSFTKTEHIIPQSFGVFENNFTLNKIVCDNCNKFFGDNLEIALARDSIEGLQRFDHNIKKPSEFKTIGKSSRLEMKMPDGEFKGAYCYPQYSHEAQRVLSYPLPQLGFLKNGIREYFLLDEIPDKDYFLKDFNPQDPQAVIFFGCDSAVVDKIMKDRGITLKNWILPDPSPTNDTSSKEIIDVLCDVEGTIDDTLMRAVAKIGFNYLAYFQGPDFVLHKDFDVIRKFILTGEKVSYPLINIVEDSILGDEPIQGKRRTGHILTVNWAGDGVSILGQVSLMNWMKYKICLARNFSGEHRDIKKGHFFNFPAKIILPLTTIQHS